MAEFIMLNNVADGSQSADTSASIYFYGGKLGNRSQRYQRRWLYLPVLDLEGGIEPPLIANRARSFAPMALPQSEPAP